MNLLVGQTIESLLAADAPVAIGVSGGKDSCALALSLKEYLDSRGHRGPRLLIHSDLGRVEWKDSLATCQRLAEATGIELVVVCREAGDMLDRWLARWENSVERYVSLSCVKLILPWSTPAMRFCTSELKTDIICRYLSRRFPGQTIISASGIRRQESAARAKAPCCKVQVKLSSRGRNTSGVDWHPILDWTVEEVWDCARRHGFRMHEAYERFGSSRVSCCYCIMGSEPDLVAACRDDRNHMLYRQMVDLEIRSTFAFQGNAWLADVRPELLTAFQRALVPLAKFAATRRVIAERTIPEDLLYTFGWPTRMPTVGESDLIAEVRREVSDAVRLDARCLTGVEVLARYEELMAEKRRREAA